MKVLLYAVTGIEILLLIGMSFALSYSLKESLGEEKPAGSNSKDTNPALASLLHFIGRMLFSENRLVSALTANDLTAGSYTCPQTLANESCQPMPASECASKCAVPCIPQSIDKVPQCRGVCVSNEGFCAPNAPQALCTGAWIQDSLPNIPQCREGCCLLGGQAALITEQRCTVLASSLGIQKVFRPEVRDLESCFGLAQQNVEGACVYSAGSENFCKFTNKNTCEQTIHGSFFENTLCSHPALNTLCERQKITGCVEGKDEVYWFDSCGNKENIYGLPKEKSWNTGLVLPKTKSCTIGVDGRKNCGNCNFLEGSVCGRAKTGNEVSIGDFVCKDLSCTDEKGKKRENLESWCAYQGAIGVDSIKNRATDTPGSRHFRETCVRGEIEQEPCADYRNEICVESKNTVIGGAFSTASCRLNLWQLCHSYNLEEDKQKGIQKCTLNPDCFVKKVNIAEKFSFQVCAPKYPPGFLLNENGRGEGAEAFCGLATQTCTYVKIKELGGKKEINKNCLTNEFSEQMNDFCISLGDCGGKVNYEGTYTKNFALENARPVTENYLSVLRSYATPVPGKVANPGPPGFFQSLGIPNDLGEPGLLRAGSEGALKIGSTASTLLGLGGLAVSGLFALGIVSGAEVTLILGPGVPLFAALPANFAAGVGAAGGALSGAAIGLALTSFLIAWTGIGPGLDSGTTYALLAAGAVGGALIGFAVATKMLTGVGLKAALSSCTTGVGCIVGIVILVIVILIIVIFKLLGIGDVTTIKVKYECKPWQAPLGGAECEKCGKDGFPCSAYACHSLGQTCESINENTNEASCIDIGKNDTTSPRITPYYGALPFQYTYTNVSEKGFTIQGPLGCLQPYSQLLYGVSLDEPGKCRVASEHTDSFEKMPDDFGVSSLYRHNHTVLYTVPSLESLGISSRLPNASIREALYVRCQDKKGNVNAQEYAIQFCIGKGFDVTPPVITAKRPVQSVFAWNATEANITLYTNEPAECKWDTVDQAYASMTHTLSCANYQEEPSIYGWSCTGIFPIARNLSTSFVRCKDQPWLANKTAYLFTINGIHVNFQDTVDQNEIQKINLLTGGKGNITNMTLYETEFTSMLVKGMNKTQSRNTALESYNFSIQRSATALHIDSILPNGTITFGNAPATVKLEARTSGGVNGKATCSYRISARYLALGGDTFIPPSQTTHTADLLLFNGTHEVTIACIDAGGNSAEKTSRFTVILDTQAPLVTRTYARAGILTVITNEPATCSAMSTNECAVAFTNGTLLTGSELVHTLPLTPQQKYYITCKDRFGWSPGSLCNVIVTSV